VLGKPVLVPEGSVTSLGSSIMAFLAAGTFESIDDAQHALCPSYRVIEPDPLDHATYERLYAIYKELYFALGDPASPALRIGSVLPELRRIAADVNRSAGR
jgi:L-ribulokinase